MGLLDVSRQAEQAQLARDASRSRHGILNDDQPLQRAMRGGSMYGSLMQDPADKARMDRQMLESTLAMMPMAGMTTYHGSPHIFNKFRMDKIGTGEGAQAYGHGLYLAENPNVAKDYQKKFAHHSQALGRDRIKEYFKPGNIVPSYGGTDRVVKFNEWEGKPPYTFGGWSVDVKAVEKSGGEWVDSGYLRSHSTLPSPQNYEKVTGDKASHLYKVDLPDDQIKNMLDWDKPLSEQNLGIKFPTLKEAKILENKVEKLGEKSLSSPVDSQATMDFEKAFRSVEYGKAKIVLNQNNPKMHGKGSSGNDYYDKLSYALGREGASSHLKEQGIPGIKYLDQGSRGGGQGTRNFVVFDENIPKILERNQQPIGGLLGK